MEGRLIPSNLMTWEKAPLWTRGIRNEDNPHGLQRPHTPVVLNNTIKYECIKCPYNLHSLTNDICLYLDTVYFTYSFSHVDVKAACVTKSTI